MQRQEFGGKYNLVWDVALKALTVKMKLEWNFASGIPIPDRLAFKTHFSSAVLGKWNTQAYYLEAQQGLFGVRGASKPPAPGTKMKDPNLPIVFDVFGLPLNVSIKFELTETSSGEHWDVEVVSYSERSNVHPPMGNINLGTNDGADTIAHEFGHALGLPDEYDSLQAGSNWCKARSGGYFEWTCVENWTHDQRYFSDTDALMNASMNKLRARYFYFAREALNRLTYHRYMFQVRPIGTGDSLSQDEHKPCVASHSSVCLD